MKFLVDMPLSPELAAWLRSSGHDAVHADEIGLDRAPDVEIIQAAIAAAQTIVTADLDYPRLLATAGLKQPKPYLVSRWQLDRCSSSVWMRFCGCCPSPRSRRVLSSLNEIDCAGAGYLSCFDYLAASNPPCAQCAAFAGSVRNLMNAIAGSGAVFAASMPAA